MIPLSWYVLLSAELFTVGMVGVLSRRNIYIILMSIELMLNAANLAFVAFARSMNSLDGQIFVFFVMTVAAAEVAVGLAIIVTERPVRTIPYNRAETAQRRTMWSPKRSCTTSRTAWQPLR